jgi:hypothetical protein
MNQTAKSEELTTLVHNTALFVNNYQAFGQMASKLAGMYQRPLEFGLNSVEAFYLQAKNGAPPSMLDMAEMFAAKFQKDGHLDSTNGVPQFFVQLMFKILLAKFEHTGDVAKFSKAMAYLTENKASFGIELDFMMIKVQAQLALKNKNQGQEGWSQSEWFKSITFDILEVVKKNFENVAEF